MILSEKFGKLTRTKKGTKVFKPFFNGDESCMINACSARQLSMHILCAIRHWRLAGRSAYNLDQKVGAVKIGIACSQGLGSVETQGPLLVDAKTIGPARRNWKADILINNSIS